MSLYDLVMSEVLWLTGDLAVCIGIGLPFPRKDAASGVYGWGTESSYQFHVCKGERYVP